MLPIPGLKKEDKELISDQGEKQLKRIETFIQSMTPAERANPELINSSRKKRISTGCGISLHEVNLFIKQFEQMRAMMKGFSQVKDKMKGKGKGKMNPAQAMSMLKNKMR
jgi:signal recognition particle subunit SRP54